MKKILALVACLSLVASLAIGGSIAYLTSTDTEVNTFTIGDVEIDIVEEGFVQGSTLNPGTTVKKNAEIKNTGKTDAWVWMTVAIEPAAVADALTLTYENDANWDTETIPGVQLYKKVLKAGANGVAGDTTGIRLKSVSLASNVDIVGGNLVKVVNGAQTTICPASALDNLKVTVNAFGIQTEGFSSAAYAYNGYQGQWGGATVELPTEVNSSDALSDALKNGKKNLQLAAGTYTIPAEVQGKNVTIAGTGDDTVLDFTKVNSVGDSSITFKNLKIQGLDSNTMNGYGIQNTTGNIVYENCTLDGAITHEYYGTVTYKNCTFTGTYYISTYALKSASFIGCTFDKTDSRALLVYSHGDNPINVTVDGCTFKAGGKGTTWNGDWTAAIEVDTTNIPTAGTTVTITNCTADANYSGLVRDKSAAGKANAVITVDGVAFPN